MSWSKSISTVKVIPEAAVFSTITFSLALCSCLGVQSLFFSAGGHGGPRERPTAECTSSMDFSSTLFSGRATFLQRGETVCCKPCWTVAAGEVTNVTMGAESCLITNSTAKLFKLPCVRTSGSPARARLTPLDLNTMLSCPWMLSGHLTNALFSVWNWAQNWIVFMTKVRT